MKTCKCGKPIYDEENQPSDKCWWCLDKKIKYYGLNFKEDK